MRAVLDPVAAEAVALKHEAEWLKARSETEVLVAEASRLKLDPGKDYWQTEHRAKQRAAAARAVADAIKEIVG